MTTSNHRTQFTFFWILLVVVFALVLFVFLPFMGVLALSAMMAVIVYPVFNRIDKHTKIGKNLSAVVTILLFLLVIICPLIFVGNQIVGEAQSLYTSITASGASVNSVSASINEAILRVAPNSNIDVNQYLAGFSAWVVEHLSGFFTTTLSFVIKTFLALIAMFYFLRDGEMFKKYITDASPLPLAEDDLIVNSMATAIRSLISGSLILALLQGVLATIGFFVFGVPNAVLWGTAVAIASFLPGIGTPMIWIPAAIYLFVTGGNYEWSYAWLGQLIYGTVFVVIVDNFVSPKIMGRGIHIHPLLILFSILGGLSFFGPEGFLLGPLVLSLFFVLIKVMRAYSLSDVPR